MVGGQLAALETEDLIFFTRRESVDPNVKPYCESIRRACKKAGIELKFAYLP